ncbi:MAG: hypothetical protein ABI171_23210 [Collimonas sp.]|uniref:hypothetical protein n=1 Tax=Collimonas sp. TaxID=1963772 RepID=UPI00326690D6
MTSIKPLEVELPAKQSNTRLTIEEMQRRAQQRGGLCLSTSYINTKTPLLWQCAKQHQWSCVPHHIKNGRWCPECARERNGSLERVQRLAKDRGGEYLEETYRNNKTPARWRCAEGHIWKSGSGKIASGTWCPQCSHDRKRSSIEEMQAIVVSRGGRCLSTDYVNSTTTMQWQCAAGHVWLNIPRNKKKQWCAKCVFDRKRLGMTKMQEWATRHGGRCLSILYVDLYTALEWQCIAGYRWEANPASVKQGSWCPECRLIDQDKQKNLDRHKEKKRFSVPNLL